MHNGINSGTVARAPAPTTTPAQSVEAGKSLALRRIHNNLQSLPRLRLRERGLISNVSIIIMHTRRDRLAFFAFLQPSCSLFRKLRRRTTWSSAVPRIPPLARMAFG